MKITLKMKLLALAAASVIALTGCSVDQTKEAKLPSAEVQADSGKIPNYEIKKTQEGEMPDVDVDLKDGQMPQFDVDTAEVDVKMEKETVEVPKVTTEKKEIELPDVDVKMPKDNEE